LLPNLPVSRLFACLLETIGDFFGQRDRKNSWLVPPTPCGQEIYPQFIYLTDKVKFHILTIYHVCETLQTTFMPNKNPLEKRIFDLHARVCKTLSHPKRLEIVDLLRNDKELGVTEIAKKLDVTKANASQHLAVMRQQNIVKTRREGVAALYSLANPKILIAYDALRKALKEQLEINGKLLENF